MNVTSDKNNNYNNNAMRHFSIRASRHKTQVPLINRTAPARICEESFKTSNDADRFAYRHAEWKRMNDHYRIKPSTGFRSVLERK